MSKEMEFFIFLIERYSYYKNKSAGEILKLLDAIFDRKALLQMSIFH